jgi:hypothetical protein
VIQIRVVRFLRMCMDLVLFLMQYAAQTIEPAVPHSTLVRQEDGVSRYVLTYKSTYCLVYRKFFGSVVEWRMYHLCMKCLVSTYITFQSDTYP